MPNAPKGKLYYHVWHGPVTLEMGIAALVAVHDLAEGDGVNVKDQPLELWTREGETMFAVATEGWEDYAGLSAQGWVEHGPLGVVPVYA